LKKDDKVNNSGSKFTENMEIFAKYSDTAPNLPRIEKNDKVNNSSSKFTENMEIIAKYSDTAPNLPN